MNFAKRLLMVVGALALAGTFGAVLAPKTAHALVATLVQVVNNVPVVNPLNGSGGRELLFVDNNDAARHSFSVGGGCNGIVGICAIFAFLTVPSGQIAVVREVTTRCLAGSSATGGDVSFLFSNGLDNGFGVLPPTELFVFPFTTQSALIEGSNLISFEKETVVYLVPQAGQQNSLRANVQLPDSAGSFNCGLSVSGYFVNQ